jgi:thioredoxin-like negative regulator of GroEL
MLGAMSLLGRIFGATPKKLPFNVTDATFEREVLASPLPVLLDVWGPSCGPCKQLEPVIIDLASRYDGKVKVCELSSVAAPYTTVRLGIQATPTVLYFQRGNELERIHGFRSSLFHAQTIEELFGVTS